MPEVGDGHEGFKLAYSDRNREGLARLRPDQRLAFHDAALQLALDPHGFPGRVTPLPGGSLLYRHPEPRIEVKFAVDEQTRTICFDEVYAETSLGPLLVICYSRSDERWRDEILETLKPLVRSERVRIWADKEIEAGEEWRKEIDRYFGSARVAVLLVSRHFLASDFIAEHELPRLARSAREGRVRLLWIEVGACAWEDHRDLEQRQALHDLRTPINSLSVPRREEAFKTIYGGIKKAVNAEAERAEPGRPAGGQASGVSVP